jgi:hypothetical protein
MIRIENKTGLIRDTKIIDTETGNIIKGVYGVEISPFDVKTEDFIQIKLILTRAEIEIVGKEQKGA